MNNKLNIYNTITKISLKHIVISCLGRLGIEFYKNRVKYIIKFYKSTLGMSYMYFKV